MQSLIAHHVRSIPRSGIRDFFDVVNTMQNVISLSIGEPDFLTPWHIREAAIYSLEKGRTRYTSNLGNLKLREAISEYVARKFHVGYDPATEIMVTVGVSEALDLALRALVNPGDEVLYHEPCYVSYSPSITLCHGIPVAVPTRVEDGFAVTAEAIEKRITAKSKVLLLNFPTNPTGGTLAAVELEKIAALCLRHNLVVLTDEIYSELIYDNTQHLSIAAIPGMAERTIFLHGFSKAYSMTGFRLGYSCAPAVFTEAMMRIHQYGILCAPTLAQEAGLEALRNGDQDIERMRQEYERRRNYIVSSFNEIGLPCLKPKGSFYVFPDISATGYTSREFALGLLHEKRVAVVPGNAFGTSGEGFVRCCYATALDQIKEAVGKIADFVADSPGRQNEL